MRFQAAASATNMKIGGDRALLPGVELGLQPEAAEHDSSRAPTAASGAAASAGAADRAAVPASGVVGARHHTSTRLA